MWFFRNHETGETFEYQGQAVSDEWQSLHERRRMASTSGVMRVLARIVRRSSTAGFVRSGRYACAPRKSREKTTADHFKTFRTRLITMTGAARPALTAP